MGRAARAESAIEKEGALSSAAAREADIKAIKDERDALIQLAAAAKLANVQSLYGGRSSMEQHLSDEQSEINLTTLLNRQKWLGFSTPQQAYAWRQQEYNQLLLMNRAEWAGYSTPDQYLQYLVRYRTGLDALNTVMRQRLNLFEDTAVAASDMNTSMGQGGQLNLGEQIAGLQAFSDAVNAVPDTQVTIVTVDDSAGIAELARWNDMLRGIPDKKITTIEVIRAAIGAGGVSLDRPVPLIYPAPEVAPRPVLGLGGTGGGGGGGPPPPTAAAAPEPEEPVPSGAASAAAAAAADDAAASLKDENAAAKDALAALYQLAAAETDSARIAQIGSAINAIYSASIKSVADASKDAKKGTQDVGDEAETAVPKLQLLSKATQTWFQSMQGAGWGAWTRPIPLFAGALGGIAGTMSLVTLAIHLLIDAFIVFIPAIIAASAALGAFAVAAEPASLDIIAHAQGIHTALDALGTGADQLGTDHVGPLTTKMGTLDAQMKPMPVTIRSVQAAMAPTVVTIFGAAFSTAGGHMALFQQVAQKTGTFVEDMVVKIQDALSSKGGQKGLSDFIDTATNDMKILMGIGESILKVFAELVQAGQMTHVAELVFEGIAYVLSLVQKVAHGLGPDVLAVGIAFFSVLHYGGILVTLLQSMLIAFTGLASRIPIVGDYIGKLAPLFGATNDQLIKMGQLSPQMEQMAGYFAKGDTAAIGMANSLGLTKDQLIKVVASNPDIQAMADKFGISAEQAAQNAIAITASGKSIEEYAADSSIMNEEIAASIAELEAEQREMALLGVTASASSEEALAGISAMAAGTDAAAGSVGVLEGAWASFTGFFAASGVGTIVLVLAAIAAAGLLIAENWNTADAATKKFVTDMQTNLANLNASEAFAQIPKNIDAIGQQLDQVKATSRNAIGNMADGWSKFWGTLTSNTSGLSRAKTLWDGFWQGVTGQSSTKGDINKLLSEQTQEMKDWSTEVGTAADTANKYGVSVSQAFSLMDLAGVKAGDDAQTQRTKVDDLVAGWINMGVTGLNTADGMNRLGNSINAVTLQSEINNSQINTLTQSYTAFLALVTGGQTAFETYATGLNTIKTNSQATGASMTGLNAASLTLRQSWESNLTAGQSLYNNLLLQNAAAGNNAKTNAELASSGKDIVNSLLAQGGATTESVQGAYALAQTMGYTGKATYDALLQWSGGNKSVSDTSQDLNKNVGLLEIGAGNLQTDVENLAAAINTNLNQAIAQGLIDMPKMVTQVSNVRDAVVKNRDEINKGVFAPPVISSAQAFYNSLVAIFGTTPQGLAQAKAEFETVYTDLGVKKDDADKLWNSIAGGDVSKLKPAKVPAPDLSAVEAHLRAMNHELETPPSPTAWQKFVATAMAPPSLHNFEAFFVSIGGLFTQYVVHYLITGWNTIYTGFFNDLQHPVSNFFNKQIPEAADFMGKHLLGVWNTIYTGFFNDLQHPISNFFNKQIPEAADFVGHKLASTWQTAWSDFSRYVLQPMTTFFTKTFPDWLASVGTWFRNTWNTAWSDFNRYVLQPFTGFFTRTFPNWLSSVGNTFLNTWKTAWNDFNTHVVTPMGNWFTHTLPSALEGAFKNSVNWVINNVINKVIGFINDVTSVVGVPKIKGVSPLAHGGSVPGTGDEDGTHIVAMGGEYMLRKPARMALDAQYGSNFLNTLNQADQWLGAGSRGNFASQGRRMAGGGLVHPDPQTGTPPGMAQGGFVNPIGLNLSPARIDMGVDYLGAGPLYALGAGTITNLFNSGWPGQHAFIGLHLDQTPSGGVPWWYYAEDINPFQIGVGSRVTAGQYIAEATGAGLAPGIEVGFAAPPGTGNTMAAATSEQAHGSDPGAVTTGWGLAASNLIASLGGHPGIPQGGKVSGGTPGISGGFAAIWQSIEGLLDSTGNALSSAASGLAKYVKGGASELLKLAQSGARAIFDAVWSATIQPLIDRVVPPGNQSSDAAILRYTTSEIKAGIEKVLGAKDSAAQSQAAAAGTGGGLINPVSGPADAGPGQAENYARSQLSAHGWDVAEFLPLQQLWTKESNWDRFADNPSSGAYGIAQALPPSKYPPAAQQSGGSHASPQIDWGLNYIAGRYGSPAGAWGHETAYNWYAAGNAVISAIKNVSRDQRVQDSMALASYMDTRWNAGYDYKSLYGAFAQPASKTINSVQWRNALTAARDLLPRFNAAVDWVYPDIWKRSDGTKFGAELAAEHALHRTYNPTAAQWAAVLSGLGVIPSGVAPKPTAPGTTLPGNVDPETTWLTYSGTTLPNAVRAEMDAFYKLFGAKLPKAATKNQWAQWYADMLILQEQQHKTIGLGTDPAGAYMILQEDFSRPENIRPAMWTAMAKDLDTLISWQAGPGIAGGADPPRSMWGYERTGKWPKGYKPGDIAPKGWAGWKYLNSDWSTLRTKLGDLKNTLQTAWGAWNMVYAGQGLAGGLPGPGAPPSTGINWNLGPLVTRGGPGEAAFDFSVSGTGAGYGFAGGGDVDFERMFAAGGPVYFMPSGVSPQLVNSVSQASGFQGEAPRTISDAASAIRGVGLNVESMTINNPVSEQPSQSIARASNRLAFLAGRGLA